MSRVGNLPIPVSPAVFIDIALPKIKIKGPLGELDCSLPDQLAIEHDRTASLIRIRRLNDSPSTRSVHGLMRTIISNMICGVERHWEKRLEIIGVGYQVSLSGNTLTLNVGYSNPLHVHLPTGVKCVVADPTHVTLTSADKQLVGQIAANVRSLRIPEPYKGKGIRYTNESVRRKSGKAFGS